MRNPLAPDLFRGIFLFSLCLILLYPLLIMLSISLRNPSELYDPTVIWIPKTFTIDAFRKAWQYLNFSEALSQTAFITVIGTACQLLACTLAGYGFARFRFPLKKLLFGLLIFSIIVPTQIIAIPSMVYFQRFDFFGFGSLVGIFTGTPLTVPIYNTMWSYFLPALFGAGIKAGLFVFIFIQFFRGLPYELQDAAYIDGCGRFQTFIRIMLPLSGSAILTVILFSLVWYWNDSLLGSLYFDKLRTLSVVLQNVRFELDAAHNNRDAAIVIPQTYAAALMSILPLTVLYAILQKYFTESIERTGIVG